MACGPPGRISASAVKTAGVAGAPNVMDEQVQTSRAARRMGRLLQAFVVARPIARAFLSTYKHPRFGEVRAKERGADGFAVWVSRCLSRCSDGMLRRHPLRRPSTRIYRGRCAAGGL